MCLAASDANFAMKHRAMNWSTKVRTSLYNSITTTIIKIL
jgi:hypothetical protein